MEKLKVKKGFELKEIARKISQNITIRTYYKIGINGEQIPSNDGTSKDITRETTPMESDILYRIAYSALLTINFHNSHPESFQGICDTAEFTADMLFENMDYELNGYMSIYLPLKEAINVWNN